MASLNLVNIGSDNGLAHVWCWAIYFTKADCQLNPQEHFFMKIASKHNMKILSAKMVLILSGPLYVNNPGTLGAITKKQ